MPEPPARPNIRPATPADMAHLKPIEDAADSLFMARFNPDSWHAGDEADVRMAHGGWVMVAAVDESVVGFVHVLPSTSGSAHIEALAVHPSHGRRGIGRALVTAALDDARRRGYARMTLRTYADVPWNAPFYASCGFGEVDEAGEFYRSCEERERGSGLMRYGRRVTMAQELQ